MGRRRIVLYCQGRKPNELAKSLSRKRGSPLTWETIAKIETQALVKAGMSQGVAQNTVQQKIQQLKSMGVTQPTGIVAGKVNCGKFGD
jgi:hypothetical protein